VNRRLETNIENVTFSISFIEPDCQRPSLLALFMSGRSLVIMQAGFKTVSLLFGNEFEANQIFPFLQAKAKRNHSSSRK